MKNIVVLLFLLPLLTYAQEHTKAMVKKGMDTTKYVPKGLMVGEVAPEINSLSVDGSIVNSSKILKEKELIVIFYRGEWCPICNRYLKNLNDSLEYIVAKNAEIIVVGPENFENSAKTLDKSKGDFILIPDTSLKILTAYDVLFSVTNKYQSKIKTFLMTDIAKNNNQEEAMLPVPATYIIGRDGKVKWRHFNYNYSVRATVKEIIDQLE